MARNPEAQTLVIIWRMLKSSKMICKPWFPFISGMIIGLLYFIYISITLSLAHYYLTPSYQHFNLTVNVADCFVPTISFSISATISMHAMIWTLHVRYNVDTSVSRTHASIAILYLVIAILCLVIAIVVNAKFFMDFGLSTLYSDDTLTGLILLACLYAFTCCHPLIILHVYFIMKCNPPPGTAYRYLVCVTSILLFFYFTLFICVLATLHSPGPNTHRIWLDAVNYSNISAGNLIFLAPQLAINTLIFSLLTLSLYYYSTIVQHTVKQHQLRQDTLISGKGSGYGSTAAIKLAPMNMSSSESESEEDIPAHTKARRASDLKVAAKDHIPFLCCDKLDCDHYGLEYAIKDHDIMLRIPKGAVAKGEKFHFEVGVAMYGPFIFPENTQPISPILWLYASENVRMNDCFQLVLPHCYTGSVIPPEQISFAIADQNSTETTSGQAHYSFKLWGRGTKFFYEETYGEIQTNFCNHIFCIVKHTNYGHWCQDLSFLLARVDLQPSQTMQEFHFYGLFNITTNRIMLARKLQENGQKISSLTPFMCEDVKGSQPLIKLVPLTMNRNILLEPPAGEIKVHDITYWRLNFNESKKKRVYLPTVRMQVFHTGPEQTFPIKFTGCTSDSNLEYHLLLPTGAHNEDQVIEELRSFSSSGPTDLLPNIEFEQPSDLQQSVARPSDLMLENMDEGASINTNLENYSDHPASGISTRHIHQTRYFSVAEKTAHAHNEDQVIEELHSFSSSGPTDLSPNMEFEQPGDLQQSVTRRSDLTSGNMDKGASIIEGYSDYPNSRISTQHVHQTGYFSAAEKTAHVPFLDHQMLECDCNGCEYTNVDHDITLRIPEGAVAEGEKVHFEVGVAMYGPFIFPGNTQPISPILWLCLLEEDVELKKPFQVILPHCLTGLSRERIEHHQIRFAKANHSDYTFVDNQMSYKFQHCDSEPLLASSGYRNYGVLVSKHCCFYCLEAQQTRELAMDAGYCLVRIESSTAPQWNEIYFSTIFFLDTCLRSLEEQFPRGEGYNISRCSDFKFKESDATQPSSIELTIPTEHDQCVIALEPTNAKIKASDIDLVWRKSFNDMRRRHERRMYPPRIKMTISLYNSDNRIKLPIKFSGYVGEDDHELDMELILPISLPPSSPTSSLSTGSQNEPQSHTIICGKPELKDVFRELLPLATYWKTIGTLLGLPQHILEKTKTDEDTAHDRLQKMLSEWLKQESSPTWKALVDIVESIDKVKAQDIRKHCVDVSS